MKLCSRRRFRIQKSDWDFEFGILDLSILFVHNYPTKFVQIDLALLQARFTVQERYAKSRAVNLVTLMNAVRNCDLVFGWFASWHTFFPMLFARVLKRPSVLVVGGYDTANLPEIGYGSQRGGMRRWITLMTMRMATRLTAFSEFSREEAIKNTGIHPDRVVMIYIGAENDGGETRQQKEQMAITVGNVDRDNIQRKGLEPFVRAAAFLPEVPFVVIGAWRDNAIAHLRAIATPNVQFTGWVNDEQLQDYFARARVYVQPSRHEGFGLSVAEAMLQECVPVVTRVGALPEVVGDVGIYLDSREPSDVAGGVRRALALDERWGQRARERIVREFPLSRRREQLYALIDSLTLTN